MIRDAIAQVVDKKNLTADAAQQVMQEMISGTATQSQMGAFLTALRIKGESEDEVRGFVIAMRNACSRITAPPGAVDLCGTGGDGANTFNISTAASFVVSAAGVPVAKHGNRSVSSRCGSADLLASMGIPFGLSPPLVQESLTKCNLGFMFAPVFHQSMKNVIGARKEIGLRTVFNLLGPMTNPAGVKNQLIGVYDGALAPMVVNVLKDLGTERALVVSSCSMDEVTTTGRTRVHDLKDGLIGAYDIEPGDLGFDLSEPDALKGGDAGENARIVYSVLKGERSPRRDVVVMNAAAALYVSGKASTWIEGRDIALAALNSGRALKKAREFAALSWELESRMQAEAEIRTLSSGRLHPSILLDRADELAKHLQAEIRSREGGDALLSRLDLQLLSRPNALSIIVLRRILSVLSHQHDHPLVNLENRRSGKMLSESIRSSDGIAVIAEYKPRSPSCAALAVPPDPHQAAMVYSRGGVAGVSVLVEPDFFSGSEDLFSRMRAELVIPMLFKDFVVSDAQVDTAHQLGADALLLISKALTPKSISHLIDRSLSHNIEPLVEVHDNEDLAKLEASGRSQDVKMVGVNSRDLRTLKTNIHGLDALRKSVGERKIVIAESGISDPGDLKSVSRFDAVLIGTAFMKADSLDSKVHEIVSACRSVAR